MKTLKNNRINYQNRDGRIIQHDLYLNQGVNNYDSPTFANLQLTGNASIDGDLSVYGNTTIFNTNITEFEDNILLVNRLESSAGVTLQYAGIEVERGSGTNYRFVFDETDDVFRVGFVGALEAVVVREDTPLQNGIMIWDATDKRVESRNFVDIAIDFRSTTDSTSATVGSVTVKGGLGVSKDMFINETVFLVGSAWPQFSTIYTDPANNSLTLTAPQDIILTPTQNVRMGFTRAFIFGNTSNSISADLSTTNLSVRSSADINLAPAATKRINIPSGIPVSWNTTASTITGHTSGVLSLTATDNIEISPTAGRAVLLPANIPLAFATTNQSIAGDSVGNIIVTTPVNANIKLAYNTRIQFGTATSQYIYSNTSPTLFIGAAGGIEFQVTGGSVKISPSIPLLFGSTSVYVQETAGTLQLNSTAGAEFLTSIRVTDPTQSTSGQSGSIRTNGGLGVTKRIFTEEGVTINSANSTALRITDVLNVSSISTGNVSITGGNFLTDTAVLDLQDATISSAQKMIRLRSNGDTMGTYNIGRGSTSTYSGRAITVNIPSYSEYNNTGTRPRFAVYSGDLTNELFSIESDTGNITSLGTFTFSNTADAVSVTEAAFIITGGIGIQKSIMTNGRLQQNVDSTRAILLNTATGTEVFRIDTVNSRTHLNTNLRLVTTSTAGVVINNGSVDVLTVNAQTANPSITTTTLVNFNNTTEATSLSNASSVFEGGVSIKKKVYIGNTLDMNATKIVNLADGTNPQDAVTKAQLDAAIYGIDWKDSVKAATVTTGALASDFNTGDILDGYTLATGDRILIKNQVSGVENGVYIVATSGSPSRATDLLTGNTGLGAAFLVTNGSRNSSIVWACNNTGSSVVGTNPLFFAEITALGQITAGDALSKVDNTLNVNVDNVSLEIASDTLRIKNTAAGTGLTGGSGSPLATTADQSHVTSLGTIGSGVWQGTPINVPYGGTGRTQFMAGTVLYGNGTSALSTSALFTFVSTNNRLGIGTPTPSTELHVLNSQGSSRILLDADTTTPTSGTSKPELGLRIGTNLAEGYVGLARSNNDYATGTYPLALVISHPTLTTVSNIHLATSQVSRVTITDIGRVGINTTTPGKGLDLNSDMIIRSTTNSTSTAATATTASLVMLGGATIVKDLTLGGNVYLTGETSGTTTTISIGNDSTAKIAQIGLKTSALNTGFDTLLSFTGGSSSTGAGTLNMYLSQLRVFSNTASSSPTTGAVVINGGLGVGSSINVAGSMDINSNSSNYIGNIALNTVSTDNYIESGNNSRTANSFNPLKFSNINRSNIPFTIHSSGIVVNNTATLQLGGTLESADGYLVSYTTGTTTLGVTPVVNGSTINFGNASTANTNINFMGTSGGLVSWQAGSNTFRFRSTTLLFLRNGTTQTIRWATPNSTNESFVYAQDADMKLNLGGGNFNTTGQLTTILSNATGSATVTFTPTQTAATLTISDNVTTNLGGSINLTNGLGYSGGGLYKTINNTDTSTSRWIYLGRINTTAGSADAGYTHLEIVNGINTTSNSVASTTLQIAINDTTCVARHSHLGEISATSANKTRALVFKDTSVNYHLYLNVPPTSQTNLRVLAQRHTTFTINDEGTSGSPSGLVSGYTSGWTQTFTTQRESTLTHTFGDTTIEGQTVKIADNMPLLGYLNTNTTTSRDLGVMFERFQRDSDTGVGDLVTLDTAKLTDTLPSQAGVPINQVKLATTSTVNNIYNGWWVKLTSGLSNNQVRRITAYDGTQRVATLSSNWTTQNPTTGDTINLYNKVFPTLYYSTSMDRVVAAFTALNTATTGQLDIQEYMNLQVNRVFVTDTQNSASVSSGSIQLLGSLSISNSTQATSPTNGGTMTLAGGLGVNNDIRANKLGLGTSGFTFGSLLHLQNTAPTMTIQTNEGSYGYLQFTETNTPTNTRYGLLHDTSNTTPSLSITINTTNDTPNAVSSTRMITFGSTGNVGIRTTAPATILSLATNNFISVASNDGFLGLQAAASNSNSNTSGSRMVMYGNGHVSNGGQVWIASGSTTGSAIRLFTGATETERMRISETGILTIYSTQPSSNATTGSVLLEGGMSMNSTENATGYTSGGTLTSRGGGAFAKNVYIGGDLQIGGAFTVAGTVTTPTITFTNTTNCAVTAYTNAVFRSDTIFGMLFFQLQVTPVTSGEYCTVEFSLPNRTTNLSTELDLNIHVQGRTADSNKYAVQNVTGWGVSGQTRGSIKFAALSTGIHVLQVRCSYDVV